MKKITRTATTLAVGLGLAGFLALGASLPAHAAGTGVTINGGALTGGAITFDNFTAVSFDTGAQQSTSTWQIAPITDDTGSGAGWNVTVRLTELGTALGAHTLGQGAMVMTIAPSVTAAVGSPDDVEAVNSDQVLDAHSTFSTAGDPVVLVAADTDTGMGTYNFGDLHATVNIPAGSYAGAYTSIATVSSNATP